MATQVDANEIDDREPCFVIGVVSRMVGVHPQTLRHYERIGLVRPSRSRGNTRLYSRRDVGRLLRIKGLVDGNGVNLAGVEIILQLSERLDEMERSIQELREETRRLRAKTDGYVSSRSKQVKDTWY